ncbi:MAG TPA: signal peptidase I [Chloroflexota bacterium]|nr:signal peptidase I [Chloroflexota bacterium]
MIASLPHLGLRALAIVQIAGAAVLICLVLLLLAGTAPSIIGDETFVIHTSVMEPAYHPGDLAVVGPVKADHLNVGDVITYRTPTSPDTVVTQRLVSIDADTIGRLNFQTKGDASNSPEQVTVDQTAQLGRVAYAIPSLGFLVDFSNSSTGRLLLLVVPGILLAADYLWTRLGGRRRARKAGLVPTDGVQLAASSSARVSALVQSGQRALAAGHIELADMAADGVLQLDAHNADGWLLKAAAAEPSASASVVRAAQIVNPHADQLMTALYAQQARREHAVA